MSKKTDPVRTEEPAVAVPASKPAAVPETPEKAADWRGHIFAVDTRRGLNLRPEPSKESAPMEVLPYQTAVIATGDPVSVEETEWMPVRTIGGARGFVMLEHLEAINIDEEDT